MFLRVILNVTVYYLAEQSVIDREFGAFRAVADYYPKYVISMDKHDFSRDGIIHKNVIKFLTEDWDERHLSQDILHGQ